MINKYYFLAEGILLIVAIFLGFIIDSINFNYYIFSSIFLFIIAFLFYSASMWSIQFKKDSIFLMIISFSFFLKVIACILFFAYIKKNIFFTKEWAAHYFVSYIIFSFVSSIFISNKPIELKK